MRDKEEILRDLNALLRTKGYIYSFCMLLFESCYVHLEKIHEADWVARLSIKEIAFLLGLLIQNEIDFSTPGNPETIVDLKKKTYELMREFQYSFMGPILKKMEQQAMEEKEDASESIPTAYPKFIESTPGDFFCEPIFYAGDGAYDLQYLDFLEKKYKHDIKWLSENKKFDIEKTKKILLRVKEVLQQKTQKIDFHSLKERLPQLIEKLEKCKPGINIQEYLDEHLPVFELGQYRNLFPAIDTKKSCLTDEEYQAGWQAFYTGLIDLFVVNVSDFEPDLDIENYLENFSVVAQIGTNSHFQNPGDYNIVHSHPIIKLDKSRYFVPIPFLLFEAAYESPYYWMCQDSSYKSQLAFNRGAFGEEIVCQFLRSVFGKNNVFKGVKVHVAATNQSTKKKKDATDIDVLCLLGSYALCIQVKSKKLTELARKGNEETLKKDFQGAVQDAYEQGLVARKEILSKSAKFFSETGEEIKLSEELQDVYVMCILSENYPALTHQVKHLLTKKNLDPPPIVVTIFDLEVLAYYLVDPYDFMYYIRQRIALMDYFAANEEIAFLSHHLTRKLWRSPGIHLAYLDSTVAAAIDRNFYPVKAGIKISDVGDRIESAWKNKDFDELCQCLKDLNEPLITDVIFCLLDLSSDAREDLMQNIFSTKQRTRLLDKNTNFSIIPKSTDLQSQGMTFVSLNSNDIAELKKQLLYFCYKRKYESKANIWIGFGSLKDSSKIIDAVWFCQSEWEYDQEFEHQLHFHSAQGKGQIKRLSKKTGRNEPCPCGNGKKYKKCGCGI